MRFSGLLLVFPAALACAVVVLSSACSIYGPSLLGNGGAGGGVGGGAQSTTSGAAGAGGNAAACMIPSECPGMDTTCGTRTCVGNMCGIDAKMLGTVIADEKPGDCKKNVCDGSGDATTAADPTDLPTDGKECTSDGCDADQPKFTNMPDRTPCTMGGKLCKAGACVACLIGTDCPTNICTAQNTCGAATCNDNMQDGDESDKDCGGSCSKCIDGKMCNSGTDCVSGSCNVTCQPSCTDGVMNQTETGVDCGGPCSPCPVGGGCAMGSDCVSGNCNGTTCGEYQLLISQSRFHGPAGGTDDFVEIYNAAAASAVLTADITVSTKTLGSGSFTVKWPDGTVTLPITVPSHGHYLMAGAGYAGSTAADFKLTAGNGLVADKSSVIVSDKATVLDAFCLLCGTGSFDATYLCEGTPYNLVGCTSNTSDRSLERKPGGALGNGTDTNNNTADFNLIAPAAPHDLASPPTP